jgi:hypothetical protein
MKDKQIDLNLPSNTNWQLATKRYLFYFILQHNYRKCAKKRYICVYDRERERNASSRLEHIVVVIWFVISRNAIYCVSDIAMSAWNNITFRLCRINVYIYIEGKICSANMALKINVYTYSCEINGQEILFLALPMLFQPSILCCEGFLLFQTQKYSCELVEKNNFTFLRKKN